MDNGIINAIFERMQNTFTALILDLAPKINDTINPMSIKIYKKMRFHRFKFGERYTKKINNAIKNNTKVNRIGKKSLNCFNVFTSFHISLYNKEFNKKGINPSWINTLVK
ncbi:hypothetical protein AC622_15435 [Bacillus sp. FJAT-27916]|nr:hypothetical protein AC622_15435 [Bacillus sp. FJAT-27916]